MDEISPAQNATAPGSLLGSEATSDRPAVDSEDIFSVLGNKQATQAQPSDDSVQLPPPPQSIADTGLSSSFLLELAMKIVHYMDGPNVDQIARGLGLTTGLTQEIVEQLKSDRLCEVIGGGSGSFDLPGRYKLRLTDRGEERSEQALERCRYAGAAPVPIEQYERTLAPSLAKRFRPSREAVQRAHEALTLNPATADLLERALCSGRTSMVYGPSGNGKTHLLTEFVRLLEGDILCPRAIYAYGQIVRIYDPLVHEAREDHTAEPSNGDNGDAALRHEELADHRWVKIRRPGLMMGGEVTAESLELGYDPIARFYQAPKHRREHRRPLLDDDPALHQHRPHGTRRRSALPAHLPQSLRPAGHPRSIQRDRAWHAC
jgi:predicted ATPase with chaperone activity